MRALVLLIALAGCSPAPEPAERPVVASSTGESVPEPSASPEPSAAPTVRLDPERCEFTGVPARVGDWLLVRALVNDDWALRAVPLSGPGTSPEPSEPPDLPDAATAEACCQGDTVACEATRVTVEETLASLQAPAETTNATDGELQRVLETHEDPAFVRCRCEDGSVTRDPNACGPRPACFASYGEFTFAGAPHRVLFEKYGGPASYEPPELEVQRGDRWDALTFYASPTSGEGCHRARPEFFDGAWITWDRAVVVVKVRLFVSMTSRCFPGDEYLLFSLNAGAS